MACLLFAGYAENYRTEGLMSGIVTERAAAFGTASSSGGSQPFDVASNEDLAVLAAASAPQNAVPSVVWIKLLSPPVPPLLRVGALSPPPLPPPGELEATKIIVADMSMGIAMIMGLGFCICAYCFFREDLISVAHKASGGKVGNTRKHVGPRGAYGVAPSDEDCVASSADFRNKSQRRGRREVKTAAGVEERGAGIVNVKVEMSSLTAKRKLCLGATDDFDVLLQLIWEEARTTKYRTPTRNGTNVALRAEAP